MAQKPVHYRLGPFSLSNDRPLFDRPSTFARPSTLRTIHFEPDSKIKLKVHKTFQTKLTLCLLSCHIQPVNQGCVGRSKISRPCSILVLDNLTSTSPRPARVPNFLDHSSSTAEPRPRPEITRAIFGSQSGSFNPALNIQPRLIYINQINPISLDA